MHRTFRLLLLLTCWSFWIGSGFAADTPASVPAPPTASPPAVTEEEKTPALEVPEVEYNFGEVPEGEVVSHDFKIKNTGKAVLEIRNVRAG